MNDKDLETMVNAFLSCALWSSSNCNEEIDEEFMDGIYSTEDIDQQSLDMVNKVCAEFVSKITPNDLAEYLETFDYSGLCNNYTNLGHDLWLTSQGHGAGFWDRDLNELGDRLTELAELYTFEIYGDGQEFTVDCSKYLSE